MNPYVATALEAARKAAVPIMDYYHGGFEVEIKEDATPVTIADREAEQVIRSILQEAFPEHGIYGEEFGSDPGVHEYLWLVDPIDGTKSFIRGTGMFSTQIALMHQGRVIAAVSNAPAMNELAWAASGEGAWLNDQRLQVSHCQNIEDAHISGGNLVSLAATPAWAALGAIVQQANRFRAYGDFYHYHRLAAGQLDAVIESDVNILDIAALSLLVTEAGGHFTELNGHAINLDTRTVLAAPAGLHARLLHTLNT